MRFNFCIFLTLNKQAVAWLELDVVKANEFIQELWRSIYHVWVIVGISESNLSLGMVASWHSQILTWHFNMPSDWLQKSLLFHELVPAMQTLCVFRKLWAQH